MWGMWHDSITRTLREEVVTCLIYIDVMTIVRVEHDSVTSTLGEEVVTWSI